MTAGAETVRVRVSGRVQGVWFRAWTKAEAEARGLDGWVRNEPDGSVAALISGPRDRVREMLAALAAGPPLAQVLKVETGPGDPPERPGFHINR
jgi:acylphosphatase